MIGTNPLKYGPLLCVMKVPRFIAEGDTLGVTAPSFGIIDPLDRIRFDNAVANLESAGYRVRITPDVFTKDPDKPYAPAEQRVEELYSLMEDPSVRGIFAAKGGDYQFEMLSLMDWDLFSKDPKWMQGYSDNTVLLFKITAEHDVATIYAGNFTDFGMEPWHSSIRDNLSFLDGSSGVFRSYQYHETGFKDRTTGLEGIYDQERTLWRSPAGDVSFGGRLIGGCMDVLEWYNRSGNADVSVFTDKYSEEGIVWYMETYDMDDVRVRKMLRRMSKDGWFTGASGFVFGRPLFYQGKDYSEIIIDALSDLDVPLIFDADVGHKAPRMTFVNGLYADLVLKDGACTMTYRL